MPTPALAGGSARFGYSGLARPVHPEKTCSVVAIIGNVEQAVHATGGWMCDRVRAGWHVSALVPASCDATPLQILGARVRTFEDAVLDASWLAPRPAAVAIGLETTPLPNPIRALIRALMRDPEVEVTVWGDGHFAAEQRFEHVQHRLSPAACAFKKQAMRATSLPPKIDPTESFRSYASWYPLDHGIELDRVTRQ